MRGSQQHTDPCPTAATPDARTRTNLLELSEDVLARLRGAAATLRVSPDALISRLLQDFHCALRGLPPPVLFYIFSFLDYSTVSLLVSLTCRAWRDAVKKGEPAQFFGALRQAHGVHVVDPVRGVLYFPRALKRVLVVPDPGVNGGGDSSRAESSAASPSSSVAAREAEPQPPGLGRGIEGVSSDVAARASSFLTVDLRTQDARSLPWATARATVQRAAETERVMLGEVRTPGLQRLEDPAISLSAVVAYDRVIYVCGGESYEGVVFNRCYAYDPIKKRWSGLPPLREPRAGACAVAVGGHLYVFGGYGQDGVVLDTYEVYDMASARWLTPAPSHGSKGFHMPHAACGLAATVYGDVVFLAGGCRTRVPPRHTACQYPASSSIAPASTHAATHSMSCDGPLEAETSLWVFAPRTHGWSVCGPSLPSPRAYGALVVLNLHAALGPCLCYLGGCAKADDPETAMLYLPLSEHPLREEEEEGGEEGDPTTTREVAAEESHAGPEDDVRVGRGEGSAEKEASFLYAVTEAIPHLAVSTPHALAKAPPSPSTHRTPDKNDRKLLRYFRRSAAVSTAKNGPRMSCWHRYARIPLGGAFTSAALVGMPTSRTLVLTSFYPAALIGYCKVRDLLPEEEALRVAATLVPDTHEGGTTFAVDRGGNVGKGSLSPLEEGSRHQRRELRGLMGAAAVAASQKRPIAPQTAGAKRKWRLAPLAEIQVRDSRGRPLLNRVSWKTQSLNGKSVVAIE